MKKRLNNKGGFTLLEIVVVLIIVGVLAGIALPNLFANVERQRVSEAFKYIPLIRAAVDVCIAQNSGVWNATCAFTAANTPGAGLQLSIPPVTQTFFSYTVGQVGATQVYGISALRQAANTLAPPAAAVVGDGVNIQITIADGSVAKSVVNGGGANTFQGAW